MRTSNLANQALRHSEVGHVWQELLTNAQGALEIPKYATFRVRATGATTVTIDSSLAMTMVSGEIALFNAGNGDGTDSGNLVPTVTVVIAGANAFVQVARDKDRKP
jgi:hypothetical protein